MHPRIQERAEGCQAMRARLHTVTAELYAMVGREAPVQKIRYQVVGNGSGMYHVVEKSSGKTVGFRRSWKEAINHAQAMESRADARQLIAGSGFES